MQSTQPAGRPKPSRPSRRALLTVAAAGLATPLLPRFARAAEVTWRLGHNAPTDFALHLRLMEAATTIAAQSGGQMMLEVHPRSELGSAVGLFAQLRNGTIDVVPVTNQLLSPELAIGQLPMMGFAFTGYDSVWKAVDGDLGAFLRGRIQERLGLTTMDRCWNFGFRQITTSGKVIKAAGDIEGLRLRTPSEADLIGLLQALKAFPVPTPLNGLGKALETHALDGQDGVLPLVMAARLYLVQSVCAMTNHVWDGYWMCVSGKSWSKLPQKLKDIVAAAFNESGLHQRQDTVANEGQIQQELEAKGLKFNAVDTESFRQVLRKAEYYSAWQKKMGNDGWSALEKYSGRLA
jgi:TRAP-type C4-dicarboxylate transport system substrate-binding protein